MAPPETDGSAALAGMRVLVVDRNETVRTTVERYLRSWRAEADFATDGFQALDKIRTAAGSGLPYGVVLLESAMPGPGGADLAAIISLDAAISATPVILLIPCNGEPGIRKGNCAGIQAWLTKPVRKPRLLKAILGIPASTAPTTSHRGAGAARPEAGIQRHLNHGIRLMLVEDNADNQKLAVRLLQKHGYPCDIASNGAEAVEKARLRAYPVILMDCQMPVMDGFHAAAAIRKLECQHARPAIVAMTAYVLLGDRERCLSAGMDDYLSKPVDEHDLIFAIQRWLPAVPAAVPEEPPVTTTPTPQSPIQVRAKPGFEDLIPEYISNRKYDLVRLAAALRKSDVSALRSIGHDMKGSGSGFGLPAIGEFGRSIEQCADREDFSGLEREILLLKDYLARMEVICVLSPALRT